MFILSFNLYLSLSWHVYFKIFNLTRVKLTLHQHNILQLSWLTSNYANALTSIVNSITKQFEGYKYLMKLTNNTLLSNKIDCKHNLTKISNWKIKALEFRFSWNQGQEGLTLKVKICGIGLRCEVEGIAIANDSLGRPK